MRKVFGNASDFFEVKLYYIQEIIPQEFDWDELTAYIGPRTPLEPTTKAKYEIQFISKESGKVIKRIEFENSSEAKLKYQEAIDDLNNSEIMEFVSKYDLPLEE